MGNSYYLILGVNIEDVDKVTVLKTILDKDEALLEYERIKAERVATIGEMFKDETDQKLYDVELLEVREVK